MTNQETVDDLLARGKNFQRTIEDAEAANRLLFATAHEDASKVWQQVVGLLVKCYDCKSGVAGTPNDIASKQIVFFATFLQGIHATKRCIIDGHYAKAAALLKQDIELFARIREIQTGTDKEGKTPNVVSLPEGFRMIYGAINKLAHPSILHLLEEHLESFVLEPEARIGLSPVPVFRTETARGMCEVHVHLCFQFAREFLIMLARVHGTSDALLTDLVQQIKIVANQIKIVLPAD